MTLYRKIEDVGQPLCHRLFVAILPPADAAARIGAVRDGLGPAKARVRDDRLHITMAIFDDLPFLPPRLADAARDALSTVNGDAVRIGFDRLVSNGRTSCLVPGEGLPALGELQVKLGAALARAGLPSRRGWKFNPHVTLLYDPQELRDEPIMPIGWRAEEIVLIHSLVGLTRHIVLDRWALIEQPRLL